MKKKIKLKKAWSGKAVGETVELDAAQADSLIATGFADEVVPETKKWVKLVKSWGTHPVGEVIQLDNADADSLVTAKYAEASEAPAATMDDTMANFMANFRKSIMGVVEEANRSFTTAVARSASGARRKGVNVGAIVGGGTRDDSDDEGYQNIGEFAMDVKVASAPGAQWPERLQSIAEKMPNVQKAIRNGSQKSPTGLNETIGEEGGFLVPAQVATTIRERVYDNNDLMQRVDRFNLTGNSIEMPGLVDDDRATGSRWGGIQGYWLDEAQQKLPSKLKFFQMKLRLHKLAVLVYSTDELLADSAVALDQFISSRAANEINFMIGDAIINGDAIGKPLGILNSPALITVPKVTGQANDTIVSTNISDMWNALWPASRANAVWLVNSETEPQLERMFFPITDPVNGIVGGFPMFMPAGYLNQGSTAVLKGRPVIPIEWMSALGDVGDILLADLSQYTMATKGGIASAISIHLRFDYDETCWRFVMRVDGMPAWNRTVKPYKGATARRLSPFVTLAAR